MTALAWPEILHFRPAEFACRCGKCHSTGMEMDRVFVGRLDELRSRFGRPLVVTSGARCSAWNMQVSSSGPFGPHTTGMAADFAVFGVHARRLLKLALEMEFAGIGGNQKGDVDKRFIHLDDCEDAPSRPRPWLWTY